MISIKLRRVLLLSSTLLIVGFFAINNCCLYAQEVCPDVPHCAGESLDYFITDYNTGQPVGDGMVVPANTILRFDVLARLRGVGVGQPNLPMCGNT